MTSCVARPHPYASIPTAGRTLPPTFIRSHNIQIVQCAFIKLPIYINNDNDAMDVNKDFKKVQRTMVP